MKESRVAKFEKGIKKEELKLKQEVEKEEKGISWFFKSHTFKILLSIFIFAVLVFGIIYLANSQGKIYIEKSEIKAPVIAISPPAPGVLNKVLVKEGDYISSNTIVAVVNGNSIKSEIGGLVIFVQNTPGQLVSSQTPIVQMIDTQELRAVGHIQEDKGLTDIHPGQNVVFTIDAFGSKTFNGIVESVASAPNTEDIVFSISGNREERQFDITVKYDINAYPELKQGMSAKIWVYK